jgi:hypothetical protein
MLSIGPHDSRYELEIFFSLTYKRYFNTISKKEDF